MVPYQHVYLECATISMHALFKLEISGLNVIQLKAVTTKFYLEWPSPENVETYLFKAKLQKPSMMAVLNYLSETFGFEVFTVTFGEFKNQFFLRKEILQIN